ncbi:MAG: HlyD family efflux transporter periplasmic adaptor subunit [Xanthomonadales bacterium]|nr:efflux RND transporter periplasmic adaptor subunit [Gammaproteobacteria bacterium]NNL04596.1 HlyD family efflux transporter periplasmic adaptor subunit [Xanthomonadales bacterium]
MQARYLCLTALLFFSQAAIADNHAPESISALGRLEPEHGIIRVASPSTPQAAYGAVLSALRVEEGDDVEQGQLLAVADTAAVMEAIVSEARAQVERARREVDSARSMAQATCTRADVSEREAVRRSNLLERGLAGEEEAEGARGEADARKASCATASTAIQLTETQVQVAQAHLARVEAELQRAYIRAPRDGRVLEVLVRPGELMGEAGVLELASVDHMHAIAEVYESDIRFVKIGQIATVRSPAFENDLSGQVKSIRQKVQKQDEIGTDPAARKDARIVEVVIELEDSRPAARLTNLQVDVLIHL